MKVTLDVLYNRIFNCPAVIDSTDPINKDVLDDVLKKYINTRQYLVNSLHLLEPRHRDSGGWSSNSDEDLTKYHTIENIIHILKGEKFIVIILTLSVDTDDPVNFYAFNINIKIVFMNGKSKEEIYINIITMAIIYN